MHSSIIASERGRNIRHKRAFIMPPPPPYEAFLKLTIFDLNQRSMVWIIIVNINHMKQSRISWLLNHLIFSFIICMALEELWSWWHTPDFIKRFVSKIFVKVFILNVTYIKILGIFSFIIIFQHRKLRLGATLSWKWLVWHSLLQRTVILTPGKRPANVEWLCGSAMGVQ